MTQSPIRVEAQFAITAGRQAEVDQLRQELQTELAAANATDLIVKINEDPQALHFAATASNYDAFQAGMLRIGPVLERLDGPAKIASLVLFGEVPEEMKVALSPFQPVFQPWSPRAIA